MQLGYVFLLMWFIVTAVLFLVDCIAAFQTFQSRIRIGRWKEVSIWKDAVQTTCIRWLKRTPVVRRKDEERLLLVDILKGGYKSEAIQKWQDAGLLMGLGAVGHNLEEKIETYINKETGEWINAPQTVESALLAYSILRIKEKECERVRPAMDSVYNLIINTKEKQSTVPYRRECPNIRFVDTLGFICPFLVEYGRLYGCPEAKDLAYRQLQEYDNALIKPWGFPFHAYNIVLDAPLGLPSWGRGMGWYVIALFGMWKCESDNRKKIFLKDRIVTLGESLLKCQLKGGGFASELLNTESFSEGSATVIGGLVFSFCYEHTSQNIYSEALDKVMECLMRMTKRGGVIDMCQGDTKGIGCYSSRYGIMPFAQGLLLLLINRYQIDKHTMKKVNEDA